MKRNTLFFILLVTIAVFAGTASAAAVKIYLRSNDVGPYIIADDQPVSVTLQGNLTANTPYPWNTIIQLQAHVANNMQGVVLELRNQDEAPLATETTGPLGYATFNIGISPGTYTFHTVPKT